MALQVRGHRLLIKPDTIKDQYTLPETLKASSFQVVMDSDLERRTEVATEIGTVVGIGPTAWRAYDGKDEAWEPWAKIGDRITFVKYAGKFTSDPVTKEKFIVLDDVDVYCVVSGEANPFGE